MQLAEIIDKCGRFSVDLAHLASENPEAAASAIAEFVQCVKSLSTLAALTDQMKRTVQAVEGFERDADSKALGTLKGRVVQSITKIGVGLAHYYTRRC